MGVILSGKIIEVDSRGITAFAEYTDIDKLVEQKIEHCEIILVDGRQISPIQRNKIFAMIKDITNYISGFDRRKTAFQELLSSMQLLYIIDLADDEEIRNQLTYHYCQLCNIDFFSLSRRTENTIDMTTARDFIDWLIEFCIKFEIPCSDSLLNRCEDISRYLYACVMNRKCCICGKSADIHEYDKVGMGRNRKTIHHVGQRVQPLCRQHHQEEERIGQKAFDEKYHLSWVKLDKRACEKLNWKK